MDNKFCYGSHSATYFSIQPIFIVTRDERVNGSCNAIDGEKGINLHSCNCYFLSCCVFTRMFVLSEKNAVCKDF